MPAKVKGAPYTLPVRRLDDVRAAKQLDLTYQTAAADSALSASRWNVDVHARSSEALRHAPAGARVRQLVAGLQGRVPLRSGVPPGGRARGRAAAAGRLARARPPVEKALLVASVLLVLIVELLNTGIETVVDRIGLERHELSGLAKDVGSTAVLLSFAVLSVIWGFLLLG